MAKNIFGFMAVIGAVLLLFSGTANAQDWRRRPLPPPPPSHRAPEPLTLIGIGAGVAALVGARRFTRK